MNVADEVEAGVRRQINEGAVRTAGGPPVPARFVTAAQSTVAPLRRAPVPAMGAPEVEAEAPSDSVEAAAGQAASDAPRPAAAPVISFGGGTSVKITSRSLQAALVLNEVLSRPVSLRDPVTHPYAG
jgi:hypothetical protein